MIDAAGGLVQHADQRQRWRPEGQPRAEEGRDNTVEHEGVRAQAARPA
jgi:hypothetical protein